ncbi:MAG: DUF1786 domain-containing protein [Acetobacteraceae bacterium]|nr:DUF1786 domain-containing protein [Acetobacteraceae bacterium]
MSRLWEPGAPGAAGVESGPSEGRGSGPILAVDVGAGTQDVLLYQPGLPLEGSVQLVLPAPTQVAARRIRRAARGRRAVFLCGETMGGGAVTAAVKDHLAQGLEVYATPRAALTLHNDPARVEAMGVRIVEQAPPGTAVVPSGDLDLEALSAALARFEVELPQRLAVAVQDHGYSPGQSNRRFRFERWAGFIRGGGRLLDLIQADPPECLLRMRAVQRQAPGALLMDTGAAALWGALCDPVAREAAAEEGLVALNLGNAHLLAALVRDGRVWGVLEHHTRLVDPALIPGWVERLRSGEVDGEEVLASGGHGAFVHPDVGRLGSGAFPLVAVTGPLRSRAEGAGYHLASPYGNQMLAGCFGLVAAAVARERELG